VFALLISFALAGCGGGSSSNAPADGTGGAKEVDKKAKQKGLERPPKIE